MKPIFVQSVMKPIQLILSAALLLSLSTFSAAADGPVILTEQGVKNLGLETVMAEASDFEKTTFALGRTEAIPDKRAVLSSRIPGRIVENRLKIGTYVEKGEKLLLLESRQPGDPPPSIWLTAPVAGTVISMNTALGAPVEPSDTLGEIADLSTIYLIATLPQSTAGQIVQGTQAKIHFPLRPDKEYIGTLLKYAACGCPDPACALGQNLSTQSENKEVTNLNTAGVIFTLENPDNQIRPGMNAECSIIMEKRSSVLSVPREAIQGSPSNRHVYVKHMTIPFAFDRVNVQTGMSNKDHVEILDGLFPGDEVVTRGSYSLGFAGSGGGPSLKDAMDAVHGHEHNEDGSEPSADQKAAAEAGGDHGHEDEAHGTNLREIFFMITTGILAILLVIISLRRRQPVDETTDLS